MRTWPGLNHSRTGQGFTLVELILTVTLLVMLLGASVFSFSSLMRGAPLDDGAAQMEGLFRFARGYAAQSGRIAQITFDDVSGTNSAPIQLLIEENPLTQPGIFKPVSEAEEYIRRIAAQISVMDVRTAGPGEFGASAGSSTNLANAASSEDAGDFFDLFPALPPIRFFPDGTSDSVEVVVKSNDPDDLRRVSLRLNGGLGTIRRDFLTNTVEIPATNQAPSSVPAHEF